MKAISVTIPKAVFEEPLQKPSRLSTHTHTDTEKEQAEHIKTLEKWRLRESLQSSPKRKRIIFKKQQNS